MFRASPSSGSKPDSSWRSLATTRRNASSSRAKSSFAEKRTTPLELNANRERIEREKTDLDVKSQFRGGSVELAPHSNRTRIERSTPATLSACVIAALTRCRRQRSRRWHQRRVGSDFGPACAGLAVGFDCCCFIQDIEAHRARSGQSGDHVGQFVPGCLDDGGPARRTSSTATSDGVSERSSRSTGRCVNRTPGQGSGARIGTAARNVAGICDVRPNHCAAATPAGPEPGPPSSRATSSSLGGEMPSAVAAPFQ